MLKLTVIQFSFSNDLINQFEFCIMQENQNQDQAIPLISVDDKTGKYVVTQQGRAFLRSLNGPIGVVSVAGMYRTGKSYLLNRMLLNRSNGFGVGNTVNACTKGLWCWATPIRGTSADGQSVNIIVIDTEGIGALDEDQTHDTRIFTLAILASSCFIYNSTGSIDETALQNLSLVVNLTKHIQIKADSEHEVNPDDFAHYFPSFYWVVRDFSLQLETPEGQPITSKQYLERALAIQKGNSQDIEEKNMIRKSLSSFFRERDCFTLIRPLVDENQLQNLDKMDLDSLRSEFVSEVLNFRKKVINKIKVKTINNKKINGEMYYSMLTSYVSSINQGAVPNIENAWNYMCREQSNRLCQQSFDLFEMKMKDIKIPVNQQTFMDESDKAMELAIQTYKRNLIGDDVPAVWTQLNAKLKQRLAVFKRQNEKLSKQKVAQYIKTYIQPQIQEKAQKMIKNGNQFSQCAEEIQEAYQSFLIKGPDVMNKKAVYLQSTRKTIIQIAYGFIKRQNASNKRLQTAKQTMQKTSAAEISAKQKQLNDKEKLYKEEISRLDKEKIDLQNKNETLEDLLNRIKKQKELEQESLGKNLQSKKKQLQATRKNLEEKLEQMTANYKETNKKLQTRQRQWETQQAVFNLKNKQFESKIAEYERKEKTLSIEALAERKQLSDKLKQVNTKHEERINQLEYDLKNIQQKHSELTDKLKSERETFENKIEELEKKQRKSKQELNEKSRELQQFKTEFEVNKKKIADNFEMNKHTVEKQYKELCDKSKRQDQTISSLEAQIRQLTTSFDQQRCKLKQDLQFAEEKIKDTKNNFQMTKKNYQLQIQTLQSTTGQANEQIMNQRLANERNCHSLEIEQLKSGFESQKKKYQFTINSLRQTKDQLQLKFTLLTNEIESLKKQTGANAERLQNEVKKLQQKCINLEREKVTKLMQKQAECLEKISKMEENFENFKQNNISQLGKRQYEAEDQINQLKNMFNLDKEKLETKLAIEKTRSKNKQEELIKDYEDRIHTMNQEHQEQRDKLYSDYMAAQQALKSITQKMTYEKENLQKDLRKIQKVFDQTKQLCDRKQRQYEDRLNALNETHKLQKNKNFEKIDFLQNQLNKKEKENTNLTHEVHSLSNNIQRKDAQIQQMKSDIQTYKTNSQRSLQQLKQKYKNLEQQLVDKKLNYEKQIALSKQSESHLSEKIEKLNAQYKRIHSEYQQRLRTLKEDLINQAKTAESKLVKDKQNLEIKYQKARRQAKQNDSVAKSKISQLEKQKAVYQQRVQGLDHKVKHLEQTVAKSSAQYDSEVKKIKAYFEQKIERLEGQLNQTKSLLQQTERERSQLKYQGEKNKTLMENRIQYLSKSLEENKRQSVETISKLNQTVEILKRERTNQQISTESSFNQRLNQMERKYRSQLSQKENAYKTEITNLNFKIQHYESELKSMKEKFALENQGQHASINSLNKKVEQTEVIVRKYEQELRVLKQERQKLSLDYQMNIQKQKQKNKQKIAKLETQYKSKEEASKNLTFLHTKQMARIETQKENLIQQVEESKDRLSKVQRENNRLRNQNQKLKIEKKTARTMSYINSTKHQIMDQKKGVSKIQEENKENANLQ